MNLTDLISSVPHGLFIDGQFVPASDGGTFTVTNPSTGAKLGDVSSATAADARHALDSIVRAQASWAATSPQRRADILQRAFEILRDSADELALLQSAELGRPLEQSRAEVLYAGEFFRWFAGEAVRPRGEYRISPDGASRIAVLQQPVGPCLAITPWNFPVAMGARKIAPALAAGCTIVVKPASQTPYSMLYLARVLREAGLPDGVLAVVPTSQAKDVSALLSDPRLRKFTFTGSTAVGEALAAQAAENTLKVSLELGGNAPFIVCEDADLDVAVEAVGTAKMRGAGQVCIAANRFLVHDSVAAEFTRRVKDYIAGLRVGPGTEAGHDYGALSSRDQLEKVSELVEAAVAAGATRYTPGLPEGLPAEGCYYPVTVLTEVSADNPISSEEIFGPVIAITTFGSDEEALTLANDTPFGLAAYVFSQDIDRALRLAEGIEAGMVAVNKGSLSDASAPFGGMKRSGIGREGGLTGIDEFLEEKLISLPRA